MASSKNDNPAQEGETGVPDAIGPHGDNPPTRGRVESGGGAGEPPLDFDDDEIYSGRSRGPEGGTQATGSDSAPLGPPAEQLSDSNEPSEHRNGGGKA